ncbi:myo-inositol 2-dehydrogenase protein [Diplodia corticola]|uniref:Myo-inositol 2-dehydrogenase protein n=1 Tax=Diplodia corticola TaxID=236234 RepID=A0A1J9RPA6_9PEZI|nr:myo-inositol 2-dehydrogenase protein [Diplodia corticola]OJD30303.1 myo-inositol 2-dehydrogenase protein [Diplodia corticola]
MDTQSSTHLRTTSAGSTSSTAADNNQNNNNSLAGGGMAVPLVDLSSRTPSPYPRSRAGAGASASASASAAASEDEFDDDVYEPGPSSLVRPLVSADIGAGGSWRRVLGSGGGGGLGSFFFGTWMGWQVYVGLLVFWVAGAGFGLLLMNRFILLTGVYKFPYPLTMTWIQLVLEHILLIGFAGLTRLLSRPLQSLGLGSVVAPATPLSGGQGFRASAKQHGRGGSGGIAGGGILEFEWPVAKHVLPLAVVYMAKVVLSNISFAYAAQETYTLARIGVVPIALLLAGSSSVAANSVSTQSSALTATFSLLVASIRPGVRVTWESIVAGVFSALFVAIYPIVLVRTFRTLVNDMVPQGDVLTGFASTAGTDESGSGSREETRAYWRTLHYTSVLTLIIITPIVVLSGELGNIHHNCYFLDVPFFWLLTVCGGIGGWAVFSSTLLLAKATSPLTVSFIGVPRGAFQLMALNKFKMPVHSWLGVGFCWVASAWFLVARRDEGRALGRLRLEGRETVR